MQLKIAITTTMTLINSHSVREEMEEAKEEKVLQFVLFKTS